MCGEPAGVAVRVVEAARCRRDVPGDFDDAYQLHRRNVRRRRADVPIVGASINCRAAAS